MFRPSTKVVTFRAFPFSSKSSKILIESRAGLSSGAGKGYSRELLTQSRPLASNAMFIGLLMSGSEATNSILKPGGNLNVFASSAGVSGSVVRTFSAKGSAACERNESRASNNAIEERNFMEAKL
jgi:hypothetical protein